MKLNIYFIPIFCRKPFKDYYRSSVFFEIFGDESRDASNINFDSGITYLLDDKKQLDLSIGKGLNSDMFFVSGGISINID